MRLVTLKLPETVVDMIDEMVERGIYSSRSEFIRIAVLEKIKREWSVERGVELKIAMSSELFEALVRKCRKEGEVTVEECVIRILEYVVSGKVCDVCAMLDLIAYPDEIRELCRYPQALEALEKLG